MEEKIALTNWDRREIFSFFSGMSNPFYVVTFRQDVTKLYHYVKQHQLSFYYTLIHLCTQAINQVEPSTMSFDRGMYTASKRVLPALPI